MPGVAVFTVGGNRAQDVPVIIWNQACPRPRGCCRSRCMLLGGEQGGPQSCQSCLVKVLPGC